MSGDGGLSFGAATEGYEDDPQARLCNEVCVEVFKILQDMKNPVMSSEKGLYVFEIGSGTGGTSSFVLPVLNPHSSRYVFSDLSQAFLTNARARFSRFSFIEYSIFNGDKHPGDQGFNSHEISAILATNVIHATMHLASTMATIHVLLRPGGHIVFNEVQNPGTLIEDLTYGLTDGWWMLTDTERRVTYPLLRVAEWQTLFTQCGFKNVWTTPDEGHIFSQQAILVAQCGTLVKPTYLSPEPLVRADPNASYLITGAVGGLGLIAALILLEWGARHLFFVSRRDKVPDEAMVYYEQIEKSTAHIRREKCNVADPTQIARLFEETPEWPACAGVVHAAGVLSDGTITKQTRAKYEEVFGPKLHGCYYLHCSRGYSLQKLQVNLVMSSMAGFGGSPGQSNHSCGNTGIESVVDFDRKMGIAGSSIAWGAVAEVGYAARHSLANTEGAVRFEHAWAVLEALMYRPYLNVGIQPGVWESGKGALAMKQLIYAGRVLNISVKTHGYDGYRLQEGTAHVSRNDLKIHPSLFSKWLAVAREGI
ncbi:pyiS [Symbiodinium microadriaticum]|nr:pyiS [Symbiodinium microadriaticum]